MHRTSDRQAGRQAERPLPPVTASQVTAACTREWVWLVRERGHGLWQGLRWAPSHLCEGTGWWEGEVAPEGAALGTVTESSDVVHTSSCLNL